LRAETTAVSAIASKPLANTSKQTIKTSVGRLNMVGKPAS
jgi:hypothetical protein